MARNIIVFLTNRCPVRCTTCNVGALPENGQYLTPDWLSRFMPGLKSAQNPIYITWTGGEPFEAFDSLCTGIRIATEQDFHSEILTSGCWFEHHPEYLKQLSGVGTFRMRISLDAEHQRAVPMESIHLLIDEILDRRIPLGFTLRAIPGSLPTTDDYIERLTQRHPALKSLKETSSRLFHVIPTIPTGMPEGSARWGGSRNAINPCKLGFRDLVIGPDGRVYPCCGLFGLGIDDYITAGDALAELPDLISAQPAAGRPVQLQTNLSMRLSMRPHLHDLAVSGPYALALQNGIIPDVLSASGYAGQCHVCRQILPVLFKPADSMSIDLRSPKETQEKK